MYTDFNIALFVDYMLHTCMLIVTGTGNSEHFSENSRHKKKWKHFWRGI